MNQKSFTLDVKPSQDGRLTIVEGSEEKRWEKTCVEISGDISAPMNFHTKAKIENCVSMIMVDLEKGRIDYESDINSELSHTVVGMVKRDEMVDTLRLNTGAKYKPKDLAETLRLNRSAFSDQNEGRVLITKLKSLNAKITQHVIDNDDDRGNLNQNFQQFLEADIPDDFQVYIPVIKNAEKVSLQVDIRKEVNNGKVFLTLYSADLKEEIYRVTRELIADELKRVPKDVIVVYT